MLANLLKQATEALQVLIGMVSLVTTIVELASEMDGAKGEEKKARALTLLRQFLPPESLPSWLARNYDGVAGTLIDLVVSLLNRMGFFKK